MNWTVSRRIAAGFAAILAAVVLLAATGIVALRGAVSAYDTALRQEREALIPALHAESEGREGALAYLRFLLDAREEQARARDSVAAVSQALLEQLRDSAPTAERRLIWTDALARFAEWDEATRASMNALRAGEQEEALRIRETRALPARIALRQVIERGVAETAAQNDTRVQEATRAASRMQGLLLLGSLFALVLGTVAAVLLHRAVAGPLQETTSVLASSAAQILAASTQQASSVSQTSAAVAETATTVDEVAQTAEQAAERAKAVADSAQRAAEIGKAGRRAVDEAVAAMAEVKEQVESIADSILILAEQAQAIGEIIAAVNDIAEQTNLLALNAAVEAARAGEHGRGFAVVASEVRSLADQSKKATVQVRQILGEIQRATSTAVMTTEKGTHQVTVGTREVTKAGETIHTLAEAVIQAAQSAVQIVASAGQQAAGMIQIRQAMENIHDATQQNLASTRQTEQAAQDLNRLGGRLLHLVGNDRRERV